jgi:hypothetical protein
MRSFHFTKMTMMERERARTPTESQGRRLRGSLQLNSSRLITFETFRPFVAEGASQPATESSLNYLLFCELVTSSKSTGETLCFIQVQCHWSFGAWWELRCSSKPFLWLDGHLALGRVSSKLIPEPASARLALLASYAD